MKTLKIIFTGIVQGIFFRNFIKENAEKLNIKGYTRNLSNGELEMIIEGRDENINEMIKICEKGPIHSEIKNINIQEIKHQGFKEFKILKL